ncbi:MAG: undecaprenyldiphospho-muramoylpentapeptide beta-N-acetylglucosaminyltransferase [Candidatus Omnitrophica bacterium]|nr:undecaprenyldiphospho-muramoylpentapeptide beta-N-acetylglucosaminyltransferase [Candidatus Omnitrophota bacterium]MDE2009820.1 undecaprenyldiphospho-muramoylpentapeptide beta-N-acetylglucosaminyltransferase [Candidatus Omnitrophota bacterium]MDE2214943.1 undecaprenyldiphospho-muramoylpentapeptide beta-N-acetylglucosaminyltransferase [Candidatus Omnitrophota bacterium]MDE2231519.1 undecaprenyldiphospho-muramoylpentapeptide beta-N-acetylglucosaminyltransferase [Candidatus Omnitrophota bacteriu
MKILIATGGTGGHIFPAIETAKALRTRGHQVIFAGVLGGNEAKIRELDFPVFSLSARGLNDTSFKGWLTFGRVMSQAIFRSFGVVQKCAPDKIVGFGSYGAFPVVMAGALMRRPLLIHEQNVVPGRANALLSRVAGKIAISFEGSRKYFAPAKAVWTGCPCHYKSLPSRAQGLIAFDLKQNKKTIVLIGGSQGSQRLNEVFFEMVKDLPPANFQAVHMTGPKEFATYEARYAKENLPVKACAFIDDITQAYAAADIVIARAGAATVNELGLLGIAAVLVPYPFAGDHQKHNARVLADAGVAIVIEQKDLTKSSLKEAVTRMLFSNYSRQDILKKTQGLFQTDAALQLALVTEGL